MLVLIGTRAAWGQPADCEPDPLPTATMPLQLDLGGLPGVARGLGGSVYADVPVASPGGTLCRAPGPATSRDVLAGPPGDVLRGPPTRDLLRGPAPRVEVETR